MPSPRTALTAIQGLSFRSLSGPAMLRISPGNLAEEAMQAVNPRRTRKEHEWALARYHLNPFRCAELNCFHTYCASAGSPVHPYLLDSGHITLLNDSLRDFWRGHQQRGCYRRLDVLHSSEAMPAIYARSSGVHRNNVIAPAAEFFKQSHTEVFRIAGYTDHCNPLLPKKIFNHLKRKLSLSHESSPGDFISQRSVAFVLSAVMPITAENLRLAIESKPASYRTIWRTPTGAC
jgi:hypothetical protein